MSSYQFSHSYLYAKGGKLFGIDPDSADFFKAPVRRRENIKRSHLPAKSDKHFSVTNNAEFINFSQGTGCRRNIMEKLEGRDLFSRKQLMDLRVNLAKMKKKI